MMTFLKFEVFLQCVISKKENGFIYEVEIVNQIPKQFLILI